MDEYIDRGTFKESIEERYCKPCKAEGKDHNGCLCRACWVDDMLDEVDCFQTADVTPVVRCKDCKHRSESGNCGHPRHHGILPSAYPYDFCSYGERRDYD